MLELVRGRALSDILKDGAPDQEAALKWMRQVCKALDAAHRSGVVHRDIKPENVMVDAGGKAKVLDFGIARLLTQSAVLTSTGSVVGTVPYLAPECWSGAAVDGRADLYALGVMLYELCTGRRPFRASSAAEYMYKHLEETPPRVRSTDPALADLVAGLLAKRPADRPPPPPRCWNGCAGSGRGCSARTTPARSNCAAGPTRPGGAARRAPPGRPSRCSPRSSPTSPGSAARPTRAPCAPATTWPSGWPRTAARAPPSRCCASWPRAAAEPDVRADALRDLDRWHREAARSGPGRPRALSLAGLLGGGPQGG